MHQGHGESIFNHALCLTTTRRPAKCCKFATWAWQAHRALVQSAESPCQGAGQYPHAHAERNPYPFKASAGSESSRCSLTDFTRCSLWVFHLGLVCTSCVFHLLQWSSDVSHLHRRSRRACVSVAQHRKTWHAFRALEGVFGSKNKIRELHAGLARRSLARQ